MSSKRPDGSSKPTHPRVAVCSGVGYARMYTCCKVLIASLMTISATSCMPAQDSLDLPFKPAQGWILVASGSVSGVRSAIEDYDDIAREARPGVFRVELHP